MGCAAQAGDAAARRARSRNATCWSAGYGRGNRTV
jgi:hypothetical protein